MKKRLLITASTFPRWAEDTEPRFILDLAKALTECFNVTVLAPMCPEAKAEEMLEDVHVLRYHYFPIYKWETLCYPGAIVPRIKEKKIRVLLVPFLFLGLWWKLFKILKNYDIVHAHWLIPQGIIQSFFKKPYIVTGHGGDVTCLNKGILRRLKIRCIKKAVGVTTVSSALKQEILKLVPNALPQVISMGCNTKNFGKRYYVNNYFEQGTKKVILFVGRLAEKKGVTYLIKAMEKIDAKLVIIGKGPLEKELKQQAIPLGSKIEFLGAKTHKELNTIYASADIFVVPSITAKDGDKEGTPTVIPEAFASGLPIIASDSGGISEVVKDGINGFLVAEKDTRALTDKINLLLNNPVLYERLKTGAIETARKYDYAVIAQKFSEILGGN